MPCAKLGTGHSVVNIEDLVSKRGSVSIQQPKELPLLLLQLCYLLPRVCRSLGASLSSGCSLLFGDWLLVGLE